MNTPIQPPVPVNPIVTIQPVTVAAPNRDAASPQNPLSNLASGTTVEGFVVNRDAQNNPIVRTALGDLRVTSDVFLKTGSEIVFKVDTSQASLARIISVDGMTPQDYNAKNTHGITRDTISTTVLQQTGAQTAITKGAGPAAPAPTLQALILQGTPNESTVAAALKAAQTGPMPLLAQLAQLRAGTPVRLTVLDLKLPPLPVSLNAVPESPQLASLLPTRPAPGQTTTTNTPASAATPAQPTTSPIQQQPVSAAPALPQRADAIPTSTPAPNSVPQVTPPTNTQQPAQPQTTAAPLPTDKPTAEHSQLTSGLIANYGKLGAGVAPNYTPPTSPTQPAQSATPLAALTSASPPTTYPLTADVIGHEADGANILHTPFATLKLYTTQPLPTGTSLTVQAAMDDIAPPLTQAISPELLLATSTGQSFESLDEVMAFLQHTNTEIAREVAQRLPTLNHTLTSGLLFFMSAIKGGNVEDLIGKRALRLMELSAPDLLAKLRKDIGQLQTNMIDSPLPHWSSVPLPLMFGQELVQARIYFSKDPESEESQQGKNQRGQRFVLDVGMSQLGPMQLDGFVRSQEKIKSFDLIVRSAQALTDDVSQGISTIFYNSMEVTGMHGQVIFQSGSQHFVQPTQEAKASFSGENPNTILA